MPAQQFIDFDKGIVKYQSGIIQGQDSRLIGGSFQERLRLHPKISCW